MFSYPDIEATKNGADQQANSVSDPATVKTDRLIPLCQQHYQRRQALAVDQTLAELDCALADIEG